MLDKTIVLFSCFSLIGKRQFPLNLFTLVICCYFRETETIDLFPTHCKDTLFEQLFPKLNLTLRWIRGLPFYVKNFFNIVTE